MTLWRDEYREDIEFDGEIRFTYYLEKDIEEIVKEIYRIVYMEKYKECDEDDSLLIVLKKCEK